MRSRQGSMRSLGLALTCAALSTGCNLATPRNVTKRYACERWLERAKLRSNELLDANSSDATAWGQVATLYERASAGLGQLDLGHAAATPLEHELGHLACEAKLGRAEAESRGGEDRGARTHYTTLLETATAFPGACGRAALGLAQGEDRAGRWSDAYPIYDRWLQGVRAGSWKLRREALDAPAYVSRRLRDRGQQAQRDAWIALASEAFEAAATRGECAREARYARFVVLLEAERWDEAYLALRRCREALDPAGQDGELLIAEASLLAGGLGRQREALGLLNGLEAEGSPYDAQYRVAGWLLAAQIQARAGDSHAAQASYERAADEARSTAGRSEALLGLARVHVQRGELTEARRYYAQLAEVFPGTPAGLLAPLEEIRLMRAHGSDAEARSRLETAIHQYRSVLQRFGTEMPALLAAHYLSECFGLGGHWERGVAMLDSTAEAFGRDPRAGSLLVLAARLAAGELHDPVRARGLLERLYSRYPDSDLAVATHGLQDSLLAASRGPASP